MPDFKLPNGALSWHPLQLLHALSIKLREKGARELVSGSSIMLVTRLAGIVLAYAFMLLVSRNFGAGAMGVYALAVTIVSLFSIFGRLGLDTALVRFVSEYAAQDRRGSIKAAYRTALSVVIPFSLLVSVLLFFAAPFVADLIFHKPDFALHLRIAAFGVLPMSLFFLHAESLRGLKRIKEYAFLENVALTLFAFLILACALLFSRDKSVPLVAYVVALFAVSVAGISIWLKQSGLRDVAADGDLRLRGILKVSLPMMFASSLAWVMIWINTFMLGIFRPEAEVGVYNVSFRVARVTSIFLFAVSSIAAPKFAEFYGRNDMKGLAKTARQSSKLVFWTSVPLLIGICLFPSFILRFFGKDFESGVTALLILTVSYFFNALCGPVDFIFQMTGRERLQRNILICSVALNVALNVLLVPKMGMNGAALSAAASVIFLNVVSVAYIKAHYRFFTIYVPLLMRKRRGPEHN